MGFEEVTRDACRYHRPAIIMLSDARYAELTEVSLASLALSGTTKADVIIYQKNYIKPLSKKLQEALAQADISIRICDTVGIDHDFGYMVRPDHPHGSRVPNLKALCIDEASLNHERIFYCDSDILFMQMLDWGNIDPHDMALSAVIDFATGTGLTDVSMFARARAAGYVDRYFNSGVMYINGAIWREQGLLDKFMAHHRDHEIRCPYLEDCTHNDQCAFNMTINGRWRELDLLYNAQKISMHTPIWKDAVIRHYTGTKKAVPIHYESCDLREFDILSRSLALLDKRVPPYDYGITYWANSLRRRGAAKKIEKSLGMNVSR